MKKQKYFSFIGECLVSEIQKPTQKLTVIFVVGGDDWENQILQDEEEKLYLKSYWYDNKYDEEEENWYCIHKMEANPGIPYNPEINPVLEEIAGL